jgi:hypothetical protein
MYDAILENLVKAFVLGSIILPFILLGFIRPNANK